MVVGIALVEIQVHGSRSLKEKRGVVRSLSSRVRRRFNLAVAEVGGQGTWQRAVLGLTTLGNDSGLVRGVLERALDFLEEQHLAEVTGCEVELLPVTLEE